MELGQLGVGVGASDRAPVVDVEAKRDGTGGGVKARVVPPLVPYEAAPGHAVGVVAADDLAAVVDADVASEPAIQSIQPGVTALAVDEAAGGICWLHRVGPRPELGLVARHGAERQGGARPRDAARSSHRGWGCGRGGGRRERGGHDRAGDQDAKATSEGVDVRWLPCGSPLMLVGFVGVRNGGPCGSVSKRQAWLSAGERPGERPNPLPRPSCSASGSPTVRPSCPSAGWALAAELAGRQCSRRRRRSRRGHSGRTPHSVARRGHRSG